MFLKTLKGRSIYYYTVLTSLGLQSTAGTLSGWYFEMLYEKSIGHFSSCIFWNLLIWKEQRNAKWIMKINVFYVCLMLLLSHFSRVQLCATPQTAAQQGSSVPGILQARTLEWVAISFSNAWKRKMKVKLFSHVQLLATPWTVAYQAPPSMGFSRQEYWSGVPLPSPQYNYMSI